MIKVARELKPSVIQVILPDWFPYSKETKINFINKVGKEANGIDEKDVEFVRNKCKEILPEFIK